MDENTARLPSLDQKMMARRPSLNKVKCDICEFRDGKWGLLLRTCKVCGVGVHKECYGIHRNHDNPDFTCWACLSVGMHFQVDGKFKDGSRLRIKQQERPTRCELCLVHDGVHAMHPLYDNHGQAGRQLFICDPEPRLLWAHSLCAFYLSSKSQLLFGCERDGSWGEDSDDEEYDDERSENSDLWVSRREEKGFKEAIHHFVYYLKREGEEDNAWTGAIRNQQQELSCFICGANDKPKNVLRIPIQCTANNSDEFEDFKLTHLEMKDGLPCMAAMHVGCARWGPNPSHNQQVWFYPGGEKASEVPVAENYCRAHAKDIKTSNEKKLQQKQASSGSTTKSPASVNSAAKTNTPTLAKKLSTMPPNAIPASLAVPSLQRRILPAVSKAAKRLKPSQMAVLPSLANKTGGRKKTKAVASKAKAGTEPALVPALNMTVASKNSKKKRLNEMLDKNAALSVSSLERPLLKSKRSNIGSGAPKTAVKETQLDKVRNNVSTRILVVYDENPDDKEARKAAFTGKKKFWKRELSDMSSEDFITFWKDVRKLVGEDLTARIDAGKTRSPPSPPEEVQKDFSKKIAKRAWSSTAMDSLATQRPVPAATSDKNPPTSEATSKDLEGKVATVRGRKTAHSLGSEQVGSAASWGNEDDEVEVHEGNDEVEAQQVDQDDVVESYPPLTRWSHLTVGPEYKREEFEFDNWDTLEIA
jgi:hypothetical protein